MFCFEYQWIRNGAQMRTQNYKNVNWRTVLLRINFIVYSSDDSNWSMCGHSPLSEAFCYWHTKLLPHVGPVLSVICCISSSILHFGTTDGRSFIFSHTKVLFLLNCWVNWFVASRSQVGNGRYRKGLNVPFCWSV